MCAPTRPRVRSRDGERSEAAARRSSLKNANLMSRDDGGGRRDQERGNQQATRTSLTRMYPKLALALAVTSSRSGRGRLMP
jgi:hypothetical protein